MGSLRRSSRQVTGDDIVVETAWLYYEEGLNQNEIAARLNVSRATVVNYLQEARERGYVQVRLSAETFTGHRLARALRDRFGLAAAYVVPDGGADEAARVVRGAADWLPHLLEPGDRLGVAWGKTIYDVAECLEPRPIPDLTVLQLVGSMATPYGFSADVCSSTVARKFGGALREPPCARRGIGSPDRGASAQRGADRRAVRRGEPGDQDALRRGLLHAGQPRCLLRGCDARGACAGTSTTARWASSAGGSSTPMARRSMARSTPGCWAWSLIACATRRPASSSASALTASPLRSRLSEADTRRMS